MATANPFDLLGDDENDDPSQLIGTQQQKNAAQQQKIAAQQQKIAAQQQKIAPKKLAAAAPAKLPSRPLPPQQSGSS